MRPTLVVFLAPSPHGLPDFGQLRKLISRQAFSPEGSVEGFHESMEVISPARCIHMLKRSCFFVHNLNFKRVRPRLGTFRRGIALREQR